jgi:hypothetical protein
MALQNQFDCLSDFLSIFDDGSVLVLEMDVIGLNTQEGVLWQVQSNLKGRQI